MENITMVIMTESSKNSGKCVAGINTENGKWVRLVSDDLISHGAIPDSYLYTDNNIKCNVLDVVNVPILIPCGDNIQPENVLIDESKYMSIIGRVDIPYVLGIHPAEMEDDILGNKFGYITETHIGYKGKSLTLVHVNNLKIHQTVNLEGKHKTKASFIYNGDFYENMSVTVPEFYRVLDGTLYKDAYLVVSIGAPYNGKYYKFIASIFVS